MAVDYPDYQQLVALTAAINALKTSIDALRAGYGLSTTILHAVVAVLADSALHQLVAAQTGKSITVVAAHCAWDPSVIPPRGYLQWALCSSATRLSSGIVSPESPSDSLPPIPGGIVTATGQALNALVDAAEVTGSSNVIIDVWYTVA